MKSLTLSLLALLMCSNMVSAETSTVDNFEAFLSSRNMPESCELVFKVISDLRIELPLNSLDENFTYQLKNSWAPNQWTEPVTVLLSNSSTNRFAELTFQSMSIPEKYLFRQIKIIFKKSKVECLAEFGRQFGEVCMPDGRTSTPWRARNFTCKTIE